MNDQDIDVLIRAGWRRDKTLNIAWYSPTVFIGEWVRSAFKIGMSTVMNKIDYKGHEVAVEALAEWLMQRDINLNLQRLDMVAYLVQAEEALRTVDNAIYDANQNDQSNNT